MARILTYDEDTSIEDSDKLVGTDGTAGVDQNKTKNFTLGGIKKYVLASNNTSDLTFKWGKNRVSSAHINGHYYKLGIDFNNLVLENGYTYTLLIDRHRRHAGKGPSSGGGFRESKFYHENPIDAASNNRVSEVQVTSAKGQKFDFNQDRYFTGTFGRATGTSIGRNTTQQSIRFIDLSFRLRITKGDEVFETASLGKISMNINNNSGTVVSYARPE